MQPLVNGRRGCRSSRRSFVGGPGLAFPQDLSNISGPFFGLPRESGIHAGHGLPCLLKRHTKHTRRAGPPLAVSHLDFTWPLFSICLKVR